MKVTTNELSRRRLADGPRRSTNLTISEALVEQARALGVNMSAAAEDGILRAVSMVSDERFAADNRGKMEAWNTWLAEHGSPLDEFHAF
jgi:antitoxin CcdA